MLDWSTRRYLVIGLSLSAGLGAVGCDILVPQDCPADLRWKVHPAEATLSVGETFIATAEAFGCGGTERLEVTMRWTVAADSIVVVGQRSGLVVALSPGETVVTGSDVGPYGIGPLEIAVRVTD